MILIQFEVVNTSTASIPDFFINIFTSNKCLDFVYAFDSTKLLVKKMGHFFCHF